MVEAARIAYRDYPTVVNEVPESGMSYDNTMAEYARMDSHMQSAQKAIGGSSDTAQISQSYYWTKVANNEFDDDCCQYYENTVILAVCAQLAIDGCKKVFAVDVNNDIDRIRSQPCMKREKDYPRFMKWTQEVPLTKNGKERKATDIKKDKNKIVSRIDDAIVCPMNWLQDCLDKIRNASNTSIVDTKEYFINIPGAANNKQMSKIRKIIEDYDGYTRRLMGYFTDNPDDNDALDLIMSKTDEVYGKLYNMKISRLTTNRLIGSVLGIDKGIKNQYKYKNASKYIRKTMNLLYQSNKKYFLECFIKKRSDGQIIQYT